MDRQPAVATTLIDDERVRVTRFDFAPGAETGWHCHEFDYVITAVTDCHMKLEEPGDEERTTTVAQGMAYRRSAGVSHNVINNAEVAMSFVEVELK